MIDGLLNKWVIGPDEERSWFLVVHYYNLNNKGNKGKR